MRIKTGETKKRKTVTRLKFWRETCNINKPACDS